MAVPRNSHKAMAAAEGRASVPVRGFPLCMLQLLHPPIVMFLFHIPSLYIFASLEVGALQPPHSSNAYDTHVYTHFLFFFPHFSFLTKHQCRKLRMLFLITSTTQNVIISPTYACRAESVIHTFITSTIHLACNRINSFSLHRSLVNITHSTPKPHSHIVEKIDGVMKLGIPEV